MSKSDDRAGDGGRGANIQASAPADSQTRAFDQRAPEKRAAEKSGLGNGVGQAAKQNVTAVESGPNPVGIGGSANQDSVGSQPGKRRFMSILVDKLRGNDRTITGATRDETSPNSSSQPRESPFPIDSPRDMLAETQLGQSTVRPMTFTYSPGSTPLPRYTIQRGIGIGGFGEVYFAVTDSGKEVALKRIQRNLEVELRGASHCLNLKHPHLVALFDICRDREGQAWVVMEYIPGPNLRQVLDDSPDGLPDAEVRRWFDGITSGVAHLHAAGLVHRDLKPGNVFDDLGIVKVGDYGLSKYISASHRGGHTESVGTFHYMAPEIGRGQYGREIDVYALGIVLYELITGRVPFDGESCHEIIVKHLTAVADLSGIAEPYRSTIARCLEKDPAKRFPTVSALRESLGFHASHSAAVESISGHPVSGQPVSGQPVSGQPVAGQPVSGHALGGNADVEPPPIEKQASHQGRPGPAGNRQVQPPRKSDEPVARALKESWADLQRWWSTLDRSPGAKAFLLVVAIFVFLVNTSWLLPLLTFLAVIYVPYYIVRQMVLHQRQQPTYAQAQRIAAVSGVPSRPMTRTQWREYMRTHLRAKRSLHRLAELNTSWVAATFTTLLLAFWAAVIGLRTGPVDALAIAPYGWMAVIVLASSAGMLGLGKFWERDEGEALPRRFVLAGLGVCVGFLAYAVHQFLLLPLDEGLERGVDATVLPQAFYRDGVPAASAMMAHFALLFGMLRWWKNVDPLRRRRLGWWSVIVAVTAEWAVHQVLPIPQPAGMMIAAGTAITIQLSAPWINPRSVKQVAATQKPIHAARGMI